MKLINGNAYEEIKKLSNNSIDLIITDPPYLLGKKGGGSFGNKKKYYDEFRELLRKERYIKENKQKYGKEYVNIIIVENTDQKIKQYFRDGI